MIVWLLFDGIKKATEYKNDVYSIELMRNTYNFIQQHSDKDDLILSDIEGFVGEMRPSILGYYWFSMGHMSRRDENHFKRKELPYFDYIIKVRKPKIIANGFWRDCSLGPIYAPNLDCMFWEEIDKQYLNEHYNNLGLIYVRK